MWTRRSRRYGRCSHRSRGMVRMRVCRAARFAPRPPGVRHHGRDSWAPSCCAPTACSEAVSRNISKGAESQFVILDRGNRSCKRQHPLRRLARTPVAPWHAASSKPELELRTPLTRQLMLRGRWSTAWHRVHIRPLTAWPTLPGRPRSRLTSMAPGSETHRPACWTAGVGTYARIPSRLWASRSPPGSCSAAFSVRVTDHAQSPCRRSSTQRRSKNDLSPLLRVNHSWEGAWIVCLANSGPLSDLVPLRGLGDRRAVRLPPDRRDLFVVESALSHRLIAFVGAVFPETSGPRNELRSGARTDQAELRVTRLSDSPVPRLSGSLSGSNWAGATG